MDQTSDRGLGKSLSELDDLAEFAESYASFNRIINGLQRQYIHLREEFSTQNEELADTNRKLVEVTDRNIAATGFLNGILESMSAGVVAVDSEGRITHFNPAASMLLGIPADEPIGRHYRDIIPPGEPIEANALRAAETGHTVDSVEKQIDLTDGTRLLLSVSTAVIRQQDDRPGGGAVEVFHDLTKLKKMEREIARLNTLAALGEMAATIAHEVRNPLAGISGFAALLKRDLPGDDPRHKLIDKISQGVESLNRTVTTLLNYTRFEEVNREDVRYAEFLTHLLEQYRRERTSQLGKVRLVLKPPQRTETDDLLARVDPILVRQACFNIFTNAVEACRGDGEVTVAWQKLPRHTAAQRYADRIMLGLDETVVETTIEDTGPGIAPEHGERIFAPFYTTKKGGTGLGLAMAWKILKAHGGDITVSNGEQGGACFRLVIPARI